jgi:hypothetical protein
LREQLGRPFLIPFETPKAMVVAVRRAFDATLKDPLFLADAKKALLEIDPIGADVMARRYSSEIRIQGILRVNRSL